MQHVVRTLAGLLAVFQIALVAGGEVVQADYALVEFKKVFEEVGADEAGRAGNEPSFRCIKKRITKSAINSHKVPN